MMDVTKRAEYIKRMWNANTADEIAVILDEYDAEQLPKKPEPNWDEAPDWAQWWAVDSIGVEGYFEDKPKKRTDCGAWDINLNMTRASYGRLIDLQGFDWRETLTKRP